MVRPQNQKRHKKGFTLTELIIGIAIAAMMIWGVGIFLADGQRGWNRLFGRVYGDATVDGFAVHRAFDSICSKASSRKCVIGAGGDSLELYYWDLGSFASTPENYAEFYLQGDQLYVRHGDLTSGTWQPDTSTSTTPIKIASQVESVKFDTKGTSVQMFLRYADETTMPVVCSTVRHND